VKEEKNHIDKLFQDKLGERSFEVHTAFLADMEAKLDAQNVSGGGWTTFLTVLFFSALLVISYAIISYDTISSVLIGKTSAKENTKDKFVESELKSISLEMNSSGKNEGNKNDSNSISEQFPSLKFGAKNRTNTNGKTQSNQIIDSSFEGFSQTDKLKKPSSTWSNNKNKTKKAKASIPGLTKTTNSTKGKLETEQKTVASSKKKIDQPNNKGDTELSLTKTEMSNSRIDQSNKGRVQVLFPTKEKNPPIKSNDSVEGNSYAIDLFEDTTKQAKTNIRDSVVIRDSIVIRDSVVVRDSVVLKFQKDPNRKLKFEAQAYAGFMSVQPKITSPFETYKSSLEAEETKVISPDFGFQLNAYYQKWTLGTGLKYYQFGEKTNYSTFKIEQSMGQIDTNTTIIYFDSNGIEMIPSPNNPPFSSIITTQIDTSYNFDTTSTTKTWQNSYTCFVIPLNFGYQFDYKDWALIPRAGLNFEFSTTRQKGLYVDALKEEYIELEQRKFGLSYQLSLELRRSFGNWHAFINPYYRNNFGYIIDTPDLKRRYGGFGATFGIGLEF
jgi:hypothetical protein